MRSCTNIVDPDQTLNLIRVYTFSHSFSNTLDILIVYNIIIIKVIECMHAYIHACMQSCIHTYIYSCMAGTHAPTYLPTYLPTYAVRACMRVWIYASVHEFLRVMLFVVCSVCACLDLSVPLPLGVWEWLRFVIVALPGLFSYLFCTHTCVHFHLCPEQAAHLQNLISPVRPPAHPNQDLYSSHKIYVSFCNLSRLT